MSIQIKKSKLKNSYFLEAEYSETIHDGTTNVKKDCNAPVHIDLKLVFRKLDIHLALLCEQAKTKGEELLTISEAFPDDELMRTADPTEEYRCTKTDWDIISKISCSGFSIGGSGDSEGVTIFGVRELSNGKKLNIVSPFTRWDDDYTYAFDLAQIVEECKGEVYLYLFENKHQPETQLDMFDEEETAEI